MPMPVSVCRKSMFFSKKVLVLYPYKNALWALRPAKPLGVQLQASMPLYERSVGFASVPRQPSVSMRPAATKCG